MIAPGGDSPHPPIRACEEEHCHIHDLDEPDGVERCGECRHSYATWADLVKAWIDGHPAFGRDSELPKTPYLIGFCPTCGHDF